MLSDEEVEFTVAQLSALAKFPSDPGARSSIGEIVRKYCGSAAQATKLVDGMLEIHDEWPGPASLTRFAKRLNAPATVDHTYPEFTGYDRPIIFCKECDDNGYVCRDKIYQACECVAGKTLPADFLALLNKRSPGSGYQTELRRFTEKDVSDMAAWVRKGRVQ